MRRMLVDSLCIVMGLQTLFGAFGMTFAHSLNG